MFILTKISLTSTIIMIIGFILRSSGILEDRYINIIVGANIIIQLICIIIFTFSILGRSKGVKIVRNQFDNRFIKGDTYLFQEHISPTNPKRMAIFKIYLEVCKFIEPPELGISKIGSYGKPISDIKKQFLNINSCIKDDIFIFNADMIVLPSEKVNFKFKKDTNIKTFFLGELYLP